MERFKFLILLSFCVCATLYVTTTLAQEMSDAEVEDAPEDGEEGDDEGEGEEGEDEVDEEAEERKRMYREWKANQVDRQTMDSMKGSFNKIPNCVPPRMPKCDTVHGVSSGMVPQTKYFPKPQQYCRCVDPPDPEPDPLDWYRNAARISAVMTFPCFLTWIFIKVYMPWPKVKEEEDKELEEGDEMKCIEE